MSLIKAQKALTLSNGVINSALIRFPLGEREIAVVWQVVFVNTLGLAIQGPTRTLQGYVTHNLDVPSAIGVVDVEGSWSYYHVNFDVLTEGGGFLKGQQVQTFPAPGYWIGGDQLFFGLTSDADTRLLCQIFYTKKTVSLGDKAILVERTVIQQTREIL